VVKKISRRGDFTLLEVTAKAVLENTKPGDSIAVNGACLTVIKKDKDYLSFEVMQETMDVSNLGELGISDAVNLERSLKIGDRLSGHFVLGHIDAKGLIRKKTFTGNNLCFEITIPKGLSKYIARKGSIAIDGISLTVVEVRTSVFSVYIIPYTLKNTILKYKNTGSFVNIEVDTLARYAASNS